MIITDNWEQFDIRRKVHDLASRHTITDVGMYFRPETLNVRRSALNGSVVVAKLNGPRVHAGGVDRGVFNHIEYDITRDHFPVWLIELIRELGMTVKVRPTPIGPYEGVLEAVADFDAYKAENYPPGVDEPLCGYSDWDEGTADRRERIHDAVIGMLIGLGLRKATEAEVRL